jgi:hypothetical protein
LNHGLLTSRRIGGKIPGLAWVTSKIKWHQQLESYNLDENWDGLSVRTCPDESHKIRYVWTEYFNGCACVLRFKLKLWENICWYLKV